MKQEQIKDITAVMSFISQKLTKLRKDKGYTSYETFAYDFNFSRMQYWRIEKGKTNITLTTLFKLLEIHNLTFEDFFSGCNH